MSQSPDSASDPTGSVEYGNSWKETIKMVRRGTSWSGRERNCVYLNVGEAEDSDLQSRFANVSSVSGVDFPDDARGMAVTDWDHDGDLDIWLRNRTAPRVRLLQNTTNESQSKNNFVAVALRGTACHPDAIGAVVTFTAKGGRPVTQSVRAGDAFISQSSRWLHFGLGDAASQGETDGVIEVLWPGGKSESFQDVSAGERYELIQGTGKPSPVTDTPRAISLNPKSLEPLAPTAAARIVFPARLPFIPLQDATRGNPEGKDESNHLQIAPGRPTLVTFWSSTCPNCQAEIGSFIASADEIAAHGLNIIGINIDNLQGEATSDSVEVAGLSDNLSMQTTSESMTVLRNLQESLFDKYPPLVVPLSFLLDRELNIGVIYRGAVGLDVIYDDMEILSQPNVKLRDLASPFVGKWFTKPVTQSEFIEYAAKRLYARDQELGFYYFELAMQSETDPKRKSYLSSQLVTTFRKLGRTAGQQGNKQAAVSYFQRALEFCNARERAAVHHDLGVLFASHKDYELAERHLRETLSLQPNYPNAQRNLDLVLQRK